MGNNVLVGSRAIPPYQTLGDRLKQIADGVTSDYTLDINAGLTQVLQDNTNKYVYGNSRIAQIAETQTGYFLPDALGSMRQMTDPSADLTLARTYDPYGNVISSSGAGETVYGYTGEMQSNGLVHLRARDYVSYLNQFIQRDPINPDIQFPAGWNRYAFARNNPITYIDPSGQTSCYNPSHTSTSDCQTGLIFVSGFALSLKGYVVSGVIEPVEAFATLADLSKSQFENDTPGMLWAITIVLNDFDANRGMVWAQVDKLNLLRKANNSYHVGQDWLQYKNNPDFNNNAWKEGEVWRHSLIGDWNTKYWDKTANQAYHFWFYVATTYFDGASWGYLANSAHDGFGQENYDFISSKEQESPPPSGSSKPDYDLAIQGINLGLEIAKNDELNKYIDDCNRFDFLNNNQTDVGSWIRTHLKR